MDMEEDKGGKESLTFRIRENPWILSTFILGVLVLILLMNSFLGFSGNVISEKEAGDNLVSYLSSVGYPGFTVKNVESSDGIYKINTLYQGSDVPFYVTPSGFIIGNNLISILPQENINNRQSSKDIPKTDKPVVELFIWSYCPYGVQAQAPMAEVVSLLGDSVEFKAVLYYDGHGAFETQENKIQECIQKIAPEKYWNYASGFVANIYPKCGQTQDVSCDKTESVKLMKSLGIDSDAVLSCVNSQGGDLLSDASARAQALGVTGSPTIVINGVKVDVARDAESIKGAVCSAFNNVPSVCGTQL
ncbi:MAG: thioredoxin domain-containing protein, partial [Nanoarchaeota archaeon]|nr:thioredoxin domain-containing protein [Nanoarchaeota archaeon]